MEILNNDSRDVIQISDIVEKMYNAPFIKQLDPSLSIFFSRVYNVLSFRIAPKTPAFDRIDHGSIDTSPEAICSPGTVTQLHLIMGITANDHSSSPAVHFEDPVLLEGRTDPRTNTGSEIHMAVRCGDENKVKDLLKHEDVSSRDKQGNTALHLAAALGNLKLVELLLEAGSAVDAQNKFGWTSLHFAAEGTDGEVVRRLLDAGANVNSRDHDDSTPLNKAAFSGNREVVETLLAANPDIEALDLSGQTALHSAAIRGKDQYSDGVLEAPLAAGAEVNAPSKDDLFKEYDGYTPAHLAILVGNLEAVRVLVEHNADLSALTASGNDALAIAREERKMLEHLKSIGQDVDESLRTMKDIEMYLLQNLNLWVAA